MAVDTLEAAPTLLPINSVTTSLGEYEVVGVLTPEATGTLLRVRQRDTGAQAELCFLPGPDPGADGEKHALWQRSVAGWTQTLNAVSSFGAHPHIQHILAFGEAEAGFYVLLEIVEGRTLRQILQEDGPRPLEWLLPVCSQLASALDFTAAYHIVHGNLSLDNVVLSGSPHHVCLRGFGLGSLQRKAVTVYTSPEQVAGQPADARSDIYALGALLYACLSGRPPFNAASREELCRKIQSSSPTPLINQPEWTRSIIARAMQRVPQQRYRVAVDIANDLTYRRSPAPLMDDAVIGANENDCSLGRYMPEMALKENKSESVFDKEKPSGTSLLARMMENLHSHAPDGATRQLFARLNPFARPQTQEEINDPFPDLLADAENAGEDGQPITRGFLGRFNRYMALQEYVFLAPDDPTKRGWRGLLRKTGLYNPVPVVDAPARRRWQLAPRLAKRLDVAYRRTRRIAALSLVLLVAHAQKLIGEQGRATVINASGQVSVTLPGGPDLPLEDQAALSGEQQPVLTTRNGSVTLALSDSRLRLAPNTRVHIRQMAYAGGRVRHIDVLQGRVEVEIDPQETAATHFDVECDGVQASLVTGNSEVSHSPAVFVMTAQTDHGQPNGAQVLVVQGQVRVYSNLSKRIVNGGSQLTAAKDKPLPKPTPIKPEMLASLPTPRRQEGANSGLIGSLVAAMRRLYVGTQEKLFMPSWDKGLAYLHIRPGSPLDDAKRTITARTSLYALGTMIATMTEPPATLDRRTLAEVEMDPAKRQSMLQNLFQSLDGSRLLAYRLLGPNSYIILARTNNEAKTLMKLKDGVVTVVPEDREEETLAEASENTETKPQ